jgi:transitional endoplasmic reticulum ATPase
MLPLAAARCRPQSLMLLMAPPGCGKTTLAAAVARAAHANFVEVQAPQLVSALVGESEQRLAKLFEAPATTPIVPLPRVPCCRCSRQLPASWQAARFAAPCVLFIDQLEALAPPRGHDTSTERTMDRLLSLLLVELDGVRQSSGPPVVLLAAARSPELLDPAILRPGRAPAAEPLLRLRWHFAQPRRPHRRRLDVHIRIEAPDAAQRAALLRRMLASTPTSLDDGAIDALAQATAGFSLAQLSALCREAAMCALREDLDSAHVRAAHFDKARARSARPVRPAGDAPLLRDSPRAQALELLGMRQAVATPEFTAPGGEPPSFNFAAS